MKIKLNQQLKGVDDKPMTYQDTGGEITLKTVIQDALLFPKENEDGKSKYVRYDLFKRIMEVEESIELESEEIASIKKLIGEIKPPLIMGQAWDMLEGKIK